MLLKYLIMIRSFEYGSASSLKSKTYENITPDQSWKLSDPSFFYLNQICELSPIENYQIYNFSAISLLHICIKNLKRISGYEKFEDIEIRRRLGRVMSKNYFLRQSSEIGQYQKSLMFLRNFWTQTFI